MVRLILQALQGMGYLESSLCLQRESGVMLQSEGEKLRALRRDVMEGEWRKILSELEREDWASTSLKYVLCAVDHELRACRFVVANQLFLEELHSNDRKGAEKDHVLPNALSQRRREESQRLAAMLSQDDISTTGGHAGFTSRLLVLEEILSCLPAHMRLPRDRLWKLVNQAQIYQREKSLYPYTRQSELSLLDDLSFDPSSLLCLHRTIKFHKDEVWVCKFSPSGRFLATASKDGNLAIWSSQELLAQSREGLVLNLLNGFQVCSIAWSSDESMVVCAGLDSCRISAWNIPSGIQVPLAAQMRKPLSCVEWLAGTWYCLGGGGDEDIFAWDLLISRESRRSNNPSFVLWTEHRSVHSLACSSDGSSLVALLSEQTINVYDIYQICDEHAKFLSKQQDGRFGSTDALEGDVSLWSSAAVPLSSEGSEGKGEEVRSEHARKRIEVKDARRTSLRINGTHIPSYHPVRQITNPGEAELVTWDLKSVSCVQRFRGHEFRRYLTGFTEGGFQDMLILGGSEDGLIRVWHRDTGRLIKTLVGHDQSVNSLAWLPNNDFVMASASDDFSVRLWGPRMLQNYME
ncbi:hypothetical protein GUITHDRAFT_102226 [Guillardia theta CCMP2712]|uniref:Uncharacterized protein n=1 Tax=Guillardia theta (strain CCMP2712) TaxID=905079 RepID=L1JUU9_GUITC|nr:hypothetical protein GUITHDRAFT_102226 [Guillardia theta CCMP2712]EKX52326.1 hypothetical protein GUITHDRAFT_102226 [Guillardia theta CCMP2712]|eukprot:XP_005839306.1 hypothetical protein GUITHDRAFT_102226 [Guillardia theta CCMP2712]